MRNVLLMIRNNFFRNLIALVLIIVGLLVLASILGTGKNVISSDNTDTIKIPVGFVCEENSRLTQDMEHYLTNTLGMELYTKDSLGVSEDELPGKLTDLLINKDISAIIEVPEGFEEAAISGSFKKLTYTSLDDYENAAFLDIYLNNYMQRVQILSEGAGHNREMFIKMLDDCEIPTSKMEAIDNKALQIEKEQSCFALAAGMFMMLSMGIAAAVALAVYDDRKNGTYSRMQISPVKPREYICGTTISGIILNFGFTLGFILVIVVRGINTGLPLWLVTILCLLFSLFSVGFALVVSLLAKSRAAIYAVIMSGTTIFCVLGGAWFTFDHSNKIVSKIAALVPHYWFMDVIRGMQQNSSYEYTDALLMLSLFAVLTYLVSAALFTKKQ